MNERAKRYAFRNETLHTTYTDFLSKNYTQRLQLKVMADDGENANKITLSI